MERQIEVMGQIQEEKSKALAAEELHPLDLEGIEMTEHKRSTFDMPINVAKVDPLR